MQPVLKIHIAGDGLQQCAKCASTRAWETGQVIELEETYIKI
jgi:hypothetical protein